MGHFLQRIAKETRAYLRNMQWPWVADSRCENKQAPGSALSIWEIIYLGWWFNSFTTKLSACLHPHLNGAVRRHPHFQSWRISSSCDKWTQLHNTNMASGFDHFWATMRPDPTGGRCRRRHFVYFVWIKCSGSATGAQGSRTTITYYLLFNQL